MQDYNSTLKVQEQNPSDWCTRGCVFSWGIEKIE